MAGALAAALAREGCMQPLLGLGAKMGPCQSAAVTTLSLFCAGHKPVPL